MRNVASVVEQWVVFECAINAELKLLTTVNGKYIANVAANYICNDLCRSVI